MKKLIKTGLNNIWLCKYWTLFFIIVYSIGFFFGVKEHSVRFFIKKGGIESYSADSLKGFRDLPWIEPLETDPINVEFVEAFDYALNNFQVGLVVLIGGLLTTFIFPLYKVLQAGYLFGGISYELTKFYWYGILTLLPHGILETLIFMIFSSLPLNFYFGLWINRKHIRFKRSVSQRLKSLFCSALILLFMLFIAGLVEEIVSPRLYNLVAGPIWNRGVLTKKIERETNQLIKTFYETTDKVKDEKAALRLSYFGKGIIPLLRNEIFDGSSNSRLWCAITLKVIDSQEAGIVLSRAIESGNLSEEDVLVMRKLLNEIQEEEKIMSEQ